MTACQFDIDFVENAVKFIGGSYEERFVEEQHHNFSLARAKSN